MELLRLHDDFNPRSPHGERHQRPHQPPEDGDFNPRSPHGERPSSLRVPEFIISFQPTLPARGATVDAAAVQPARPDFNPRSPHGERRCPPSGRAPVLIYFNPRSPHGERRIERRFFGCVGKFQPTLPARGATYVLTSDFANIEHFNPRSPHGERRDRGGNPEGRFGLFQPTLPARGATPAGRDGFR